MNDADTIRKEMLKGIRMGKQLKDRHYTDYKKNGSPLDMQLYEFYRGYLDAYRDAYYDVFGVDLDTEEVMNS